MFIQVLTLSMISSDFMMSTIFPNSINGFSYILYVNHKYKKGVLYNRRYMERSKIFTSTTIMIGSVIFKPQNLRTKKISCTWLCNNFILFGTKFKDSTTNNTKNTSQISMTQLCRGLRKIYRILKGIYKALANNYDRFLNTFFRKYDF